MSAALANPLPDRPAILPLPSRPAAQAKPENAEFSARDVFNALRYHSILFLFVGTLVAAAAGFAAWNAFPAKYTTHAMLRASASEQNVVDKGPGYGQKDFGTFLSTQAAMIKSHKILSRALGQNVGKGRTLKQLPMIDGQVDPIAYLSEKLLIEFSDRSEIMKVGLEGNDPEQIASAVNAVVDAFDSEVKAYREQRGKNYDRLLRTKNEREKELEDLRKSYQQQFTPVAGNETKLKSKQARVAMYLQAVNEENRVALDVRRVREQLAVAQVKLKAQQDQDAKPQEAAAVPELSGYLENDGAVQKKQAEVTKLESYISYRVRTDRDSDNEEIRGFQQKAARERNQLDVLKREKLAQLTKAYLEQQRKLPGNQDATIEVKSLQGRLSDLQIEEKLRKEELVKFGDLMTDEAVAAKPPEQFLAEIKLQQAQEHVSKLIATVDAQKIELNADDRISLYEKAHVPQNKEMKKQLAFTGVAGVAGYALIGGLITVFEVRRKRVYSHRDPVFTRLPLLGRIPEHGFVLPAAGADPAEDDQAGQNFREAIDRVKTLAVRQMTRGHMRSLLIASPAADEGKSILAWNLAAGFARTDYRVLFVDANFIKPSIHHHLDVTEPRGLAEVLRGECALPEVVLDTPVPNLYCLPAGQADDEARRALDKPALTKLLDRTRGQYDFVVFDTCALGEAVDPLCLAQRVDAVILSLRTFKSRTPGAETAAKQLQALGTPLLGVVLTDPMLKAGDI